MCICDAARLPNKAVSIVITFIPGVAVYAPVSIFTTLVIIADMDIAVWTSAE